MTSLAPTPTALRDARRLATRPGVQHRPVPVDPVSTAVRMATAYVEVRSGRRCIQQLRDVVPHDAFRRLTWAVVRQRQQPPPRGGASVHRVIACRLSPDAVEVSVVIRDGDRIRAVAVRMERQGRWRVADIGLPEDLPAVRPRGTS